MARTASPTIWAWISWATAGSVFFAGTWWVLQQDNSSIFFDDTNNRLGLMTTAPTHTLTLWSTGTGIAIYNTADQTTNFERGIIQWSSNTLLVGFDKAGSGSNRQVRVGAHTSGAVARLDMIFWTSPLFNFSHSNSSVATILNHNATVTASNIVQTILNLSPTITQTSTAWFTILDLNPTLSTTWSGAKNAILYRNASWSTLFGVDYLWVMSFSNAVTAWIAVASTHRIAVVDGWTTYYLLATTVA